LLKNSEAVEIQNYKETLTGQEVADLVEKVFSQVPSELRQHLVDSNVVLTLAGLKGET